jgi:pimeloyl-ACP methyl ester carboxylesterase/AraC-like DNA-binding protein
MEVLEQILRSLRLTGGVITDADFTGDFCVQAEFTPEKCAPFFPLPEKLIAYHYVRSGEAFVEVDGVAPVKCRAGEVVILPGNAPHRLSSQPGLEPARVEDITVVTDEGVHRIQYGSDGPGAQFWCGFLGTAAVTAHPLLDALPPLLTLDVDAGEEAWLDASMRFLAREQPGPEMVARIAEVFIAHAIREYVETLPAHSQGWLRGLSDPAVSKALAMIHRSVADDLDVETLAREAGVSRTVLGERFTELIGEPPMRYAARWRMRLAANMLLEGRRNSASIAYAVGFNSEAAFNRAFKREYGEPPATWKRRMDAEEEQKRAALGRPPLPPQRVEYCTASDGTRLAWSAVGEGPCLVKTANWLNHLEFDFDSPIWRGWIANLASDFRLIRYDERGNGLSDWNAPDLSLDAFVEDLATVVDAAGLDHVDLLGISQGAAVSIAYSLRYPGRVRRLVLLNGYAAGWRARGDNEEISRREAMLTLTELGWGQDNPAYRQLFTNFYVPGANAEQASWFNELQRRSTSPQIAVRLMRVLSAIDVRKLLPAVTVPTLVLHSRGDQAIPFSAGEELARDIPGARFVPLDGQNHILLEGEPAFRKFIEETRAFLRDGAPSAQRAMKVA